MPHYNLATANVRLLLKRMQRKIAVAAKSMGCRIINARPRPRVRVLAKRRLTRNLAAKLCASRKHPGNYLTESPGMARFRPNTLIFVAVKLSSRSTVETCDSEKRDCTLPAAMNVAIIAAGWPLVLASRERNDVINELVILPNNNCRDERLRVITVTIIAETKRPGKFSDVRIMHSRARCAGSWVNLQADNGILFTAW